MPTPVLCCVAWLAGVAGLFMLLPPADWGAGGGLAVVLGLLTLSGLIYGVMLVSVLLDWLFRRIEGGVTS